MFSSRRRTSVVALRGNTRRTRKQKEKKAKKEKVQARRKPSLRSVGSVRRNAATAQRKGKVKKVRKDSSSQRSKEGQLLVLLQQNIAISKQRSTTTMAGGSVDPKQPCTQTDKQTHKQMYVCVYRMAYRIRELVEAEGAAGRGNV